MSSQSCGLPDPELTRAFIKVSGAFCPQNSLGSRNRPCTLCCALHLRQPKGRSPFGYQSSHHNIYTPNTPICTYQISVASRLFEGAYTLTCWTCAHIERNAILYKIYDLL